MLQTESWGARSGEVFAGGTAITAVVVPPGSVYLLGDNRPGSSDSRHLGPISEEQILGVVSRVLWSRDSCSGGTRWERIGEGLR
jgi:signal peptidase I